MLTPKEKAVTLAGATASENLLLTPNCTGFARTVQDAAANVEGGA